MTHNCEVADAQIGKASRAWGLLLCAVLLIATVTRFVFDGRQLLPWTQLVAAPLVLLIFSRVKVAGVSLPRWVVFTSLAGMVAGAALTYSHIDLAQGAFVVARLEDDELEKSTKIFRDRIRKTIGWRGLTLIGTHSGIVTSEEEAAQILNSSTKLGGVIWGTPRWLNVTLRPHSPLSLFEGGGARFADDFGITKRLRSLRLITSVPSTGLSSSGEYPTVEYLGELAVSWSMFEQALLHPATESPFEMLARALAGVKGQWSSNAHRAVPMWMIGTYHLRRYVAQEQVEDGELQCALRSFTAAFSQLRERDSPAIKAAILNNQALAYILRARQGQDRARILIQARRMLTQALSFARHASSFAATGEGTQASASIVAENLGALSPRRKQKIKQGRRKKVIVSERPTQATGQHGSKKTKVKRSVMPPGA